MGPDDGGDWWVSIIIFLNSASPCSGLALPEEQPSNRPLVVVVSELEG